jgi:hypothetical protein
MHFAVSLLSVLQPCASALSHPWSACSVYPVFDRGLTDELLMCDFFYFDPSKNIFHK